MTAFHFTRDLHESEGTHALVCEREKIRDLRDCMLDDRAWEGHTREEALQAVLSFQMPDGSFSLVSDYHIGSEELERLPLRKQEGPRCLGIGGLLRWAERQHKHRKEQRPNAPSERRREQVKWWCQTY